MNNNFLSRNHYNKSFVDESSSEKINFPPNIFQNRKEFKDLYIHTNILQNIAQRETQIYKLYQKNLGKHFFGVKPASLLLFEKRLKQYFNSTHFLRGFYGKKTKNLDEKINIGSLDFLVLGDKNNKTDILNSIKHEKILSISRNFSLQQTKDVVSQEFFKMKYLQKNAKRIAKILSNKKNKNNSKSENKKKIDNNNSNMKTPEPFTLKRRESDDAVKSFSNNYLNIDINSIRKAFKHNSLNYKSKNNLNNLQIFEYTKKDKPKLNKNYWLNTSNISLNTKNNKNNEIMSSLITKKINKNNLTDYNKSKGKKKFINSRNSDINLYINKYHTHTNFTDRHMLEKKDKLFLLNLGKIKKLSKNFNISINNNINGLDDYSRHCKSKLLRILYTNNIDKKIYIIKKEDKTELNELKSLLFDDIYNSNNTNNKNENEKKLIKDKQDNQEKFTRTMNANNPKKLIDINGGNINKKIINLEIKKIIEDSSENKRKKGNIKKAREKCKENFTTIIKLRENIKYKSEKLIQELRSLKAKK